MRTAIHRHDDIRSPEIGGSRNHKEFDSINILFGLGDKCHRVADLAVKQDLVGQPLFAVSAHFQRAINLKFRFVAFANLTTHFLTSSFQ